MKKSLYVVFAVLVIGAMLLTACAQSSVSASWQDAVVTGQTEKISNVAAIPERGAEVSFSNSSVAQSSTDPTPTPIPTAQTRFDEQFAMLDAAVVIPAGARDATVKYLSPMNGKQYFIQKFYFTSGGVGFAIYRGEAVWVKAPVGTLDSQGIPVSAMEVVVPIGEDIGISQFFWEAVPTAWAVASDFSTSISLENNPWYK